MDGLPSGTVIEGYTVLGVLGAGGMGTVYRVRDEAGAQFALKVVFRAPTSDEATFEGRITREANVARVIRHPGVATVHGHGLIDADRAFLVMDLLKGRDLDRCIAEQTLSLADFFSYVREALSTLEVAHAIVTLDGQAEPLVHRDLKPANLFVLEPPVDGVRVKIVDFGLVGQHGAAKLTRDGAGFGTPNYMAPEQFGDAHAATPATDVWAVAVMIYEAVSGVSPFAGPTIHATLMNVAAGHPKRLDEVVPECPTGLASLLDDCFDPDATKRPANAAMFGRALDTLLGDPQVQAFMQSRRALDPEKRVVVAEPPPAEAPSAALRANPPIAAQESPTVELDPVVAREPELAPVRPRAAVATPEPAALPAWARGVIAFVAAGLGYFVVRFLLAGA